MKRIIVHALSGMVGIAICVGIATLSQILHLAPKIPAPGGEDDFAFRAALFFFGMCPAFAVLGIYISALSESSIRVVIHSWTGAVCASFLVLLSARILHTKLENLTVEGEGNRATILLFTLWFIAATAGALFTQIRRKQRRDA